MVDQNPEKNTAETVILGQTTQPFQDSAQDNARKKYEIIRPLGKGGFAWVYLVKNLDLNRLEAIKILSSDLHDDDVLDRFVKEARISANFNHQNIITIFEVQREGYWEPFIAPEKIISRHSEPFTYFTMSFVEGHTASDLLKKNSRVPLRKTLKIAIGAAKALDYAHSKAVTHRDIKPENILVDRHGEAILMDFGIAKAADQTRKTAAGTFMGTARYVSPEQAMGQEVDGRSDLYSLGITLFELITGRAPFDSEEWMTVLYQHIHEAPPAPSDFVPDLDRDFQNIILTLLEKSPKNRYQSAKELLAPLMQIYTRLGGEEYGTEAMEKIATRADLMQKVTPSKLTDHPPVRTGGIKEKLQPAPSQDKPKKSGLKWALTLPVIAILAALVYWFYPAKPKLKEVPPKKTEPVVQMGTLFVSTFPPADAFRIENSKHQEVPVSDSKIPLQVELPPGDYTFYFSFHGENIKKETFVEAGKKAKVHAFFEIDDSNYLLEDLK